MTNQPSFPTLRHMSNLTRKIIAVIMLLWLPLSSGSALAASLGMQLQQGECHDSSMMMDMSHDDMGEHHMMHQDSAQTSDDTASSCSACSVCHLACSGYIAVAPTSAQILEATSQVIAFLPESFTSHITAPLLPPPLVRA
ncbi:MAG: DUF2946 family protein [Sideroxydans sp.]|nr:DUF2946 family protein [Sideroxydans sp.]